MAKYVDEATARAHAEKGTLIGKTEPCRDSKYMWWEVYEYNGIKIACCCEDSYGIVCGDQIEEHELEMYRD